MLDYPRHELTLITGRVINAAHCYNSGMDLMIRSFHDKETEKVFERKFSKKLSHDIHRAAYRKLLMLHHAIDLRDLLSPPANHLEALKGNRKGQYSIRINKQWRICFTWKNNNAYEVEIVDYH